MRFNCAIIKKASIPITSGHCEHYGKGNNASGMRLGGVTARETNIAMETSRFLCGVGAYLPNNVPATLMVLNFHSTEYSVLSCTHKHLFQFM
jgi:hypothetical protein